MNILAIDAGTTGVTVLVVDEQGAIASRGYCEFEQHFPKPGWVEHDPEQIWQSALSASRAALASGHTIDAIGITNQRETMVLWDRESLEAPRKAIVWQDRRTSDIVAELANHEELIRARTGTSLDPYFTSTKLVWIQRNEPDIWQGVLKGKTAIGTIDSYIVARLSAGQSHITDASNASRTQLCNIESATWDDELLALFGVPKSALPEIVPNYGQLAMTDTGAFLGLEAPITGIAGDQQAALFGQAAFNEGDSKCTYGTGAFLLTNTGKNRVASQNGLITTIAWKHPDGTITYALEGSVFVAGSAVQWLRDGLKIIEKSKDVEDLANQVDSSEGVVFVPALTGLGAPWWDSEARGTLFGLTRGTTNAHIARATLEAVAFQVNDLAQAMEQDLGRGINKLRVDGGMSENSLLMQLQATILGRCVERGTIAESTGIGAAYLAGLGAGIFESTDELATKWKLRDSFNAGVEQVPSLESWHRAIQATSNWHK